MTDKKLNELFDRYKNYTVEPPKHLKYQIRDRISRQETTKQSHFEKFTHFIRNFFSYQKNIKALAVSLSLIVVMFFTVITIYNNSTFNTKDNFTMAEHHNEATSYSESSNMFEIKLHTVNKKDSEIIFNTQNWNITPEGKIISVGEFNVIETLDNPITFEVEKFGKIKMSENTFLMFELKKETLDIKLNKGKIDILGKNYINSGLKYIVETPSSIIKTGEGDNITVTVFDNKDSIVIVNKGTAEAESNIIWNSEIKNPQKTMLSAYIKDTYTLKESDRELFVMKDIIDYSNYVNENYQRLLTRYVND